MRKPRYKVIKRLSRSSAMIHGNSKYGLKYLPGRETYAQEGTLGVFVFKTKRAAQEWADIWNGESFYSRESKDLIVVEVTPIGRGKTVVFASSCIGTEDLDYFYKENQDYYYSHVEVPDNTMAYPGVYVCE